MPSVVGCGLDAYPTVCRARCYNDSRPVISALHSAALVPIDSISDSGAKVSANCSASAVSASGRSSMSFWLPLDTSGRQTDRCISSDDVSIRWMSSLNACSFDHRRPDERQLDATMG
jgi:hypothetical protein